jgi:hypothetical protein
MSVETAARSSSTRGKPPILPLVIGLVCLALPAELGIGFLAYSLHSNAAAVLFFFTYLPLLFGGIFVVEPVAILVAAIYTIRATRDAVWSSALTVCWIGLTLHSAAIGWAFYVAAAGPRGVWGR